MNRSYLINTQLILRLLGVNLHIINKFKQVIYLNIFATRLQEKWLPFCGLYPPRKKGKNFFPQF